MCMTVIPTVYIITFSGFLLCSYLFIFAHPELAIAYQEQLSVVHFKEGLFSCSLF